MHVASGLVMDTNTGDNNFCINLPTGAASQQYYLTTVDGEANLYNIKISDGSGYFGWRTGGKSYIDSNPSSENAKWWVELQDAETETIAFNRYARNGHIGSGSTAPGSTVNTNSGVGTSSYWQLVEYTDGQLFKIALETNISTAEELIANAEIGEETWKYKQEVVDALNEVLSNAKSALTTATTQEELNEACIALADAIAVFKDSWNKPVFAPAPGEKYRFAVGKYSTNYMTVSGGKIGTASYTIGDANQHWEFEDAGDGSYYIINNGQALAYDFSMVDKTSAPTWKMVYTNTGSVDMFAIVKSEDPTQVLTFSKGTSPVFQTLTLSNNAHQGRFTKVDMPNDPDRTNLENAIGSARKTLREIDRGNQIGQWSDGTS